MTQKTTGNGLNRMDYSKEIADRLLTDLEATPCLKYLSLNEARVICMLLRTRKVERQISEEEKCR